MVACIEKTSQHSKFLGSEIFIILFQAYRVELELELNQLREENEKLKQIVVSLRFHFYFFLS